MSTITIAIVEETLTDGSHAYNVELRRRAGAFNFVLTAVTEHDASLLAAKLIAAINNHTNETVIGSTAQSWAAILDPESAHLFTPLEREEARQRLEDLRRHIASKRS